MSVRPALRSLLVAGMIAEDRVPQLREISGASRGITASEGRVAVVTGAAGILGPVICRDLRTAGWKVAASDFDLQKFEEHERIYGSPVDADLHLGADLSRRAECLQLIDAVKSRIGRIGLLVNNATAHASGVPLCDLTEPHCERILRVDLLAPLFLAQAARASMAGNDGLIVNISSIRTKNIVAGSLLYSTAKAALEKMTEALAIELAPDGIRANAIRVGAITGDAFLRPALRMLPKDLAGRLHAEVMEMRASRSRRGPLAGRSGLPSDVAQMILYLASPLGQFINGATIPVDGAFTLAQRKNEAVSSDGPVVDVQSWRSDPAGELKKWLASRNIKYEI